MQLTMSNQNSWSQALNNAFDLTSTWVYLDSMPGFLDAPEARFDERPTVGRPGTDLRVTGHKAKTFTIVMNVFAAGQTIEERIAELIRETDLSAGEVTFTYNIGGTNYTIEAYRLSVAKVMQPDRGQGVNASLAMTFRASYPYFALPEISDVEITSVSNNGFSAVEAFSTEDYFFGHTGNAIIMDGFSQYETYVESWPRFEITGPFTKVMLTKTRGASPNKEIEAWLRYEHTVSLGQTLVIETFPGSQSATVGNADRFSFLDPNSELFSVLPRGPSILPIGNNVAASFIGADNVNTGVTIYLTPVVLTPGEN